MSDRPASRSKRPRPLSHPSPGDEVVIGVPANEPENTGPTAVPNPTRGGEDVRRRGWFWHWNSIVTQYAPLIGLKGVGLLNSYTVWTDRREESPHRGYAFPSQQSEADFYGEDRAELITINKLLVALDLIEIRKEMVLRVDEQGRRWKVPHNFYRVKDHGDGSSLTSQDVLRVAELADRDQTVYRYIRRVFSPKFSAIDRDNVWVKILAEVRETEVWRRLSERATRDEQRASDRTKAGHAARKGAFILPIDGDTATPATPINDSGADRKRSSRATSVATTNNGSPPDVAPINNGLDADPATSVGPVNTGPATGVDLTNRTYNQSLLTTTTTTAGSKRSKTETTTRSFDMPRSASHIPVTSQKKPVTGPAGAGPGGQEAPSDPPGESRAVGVFEDANGRRATAAERHLLRGLAERFDPAARASGTANYSTGWEWVAAGIYEAVESGSTFVAPRRLREILTRWERDGLPAAMRSGDDNPMPPGGRRHGSGLEAGGVDIVLGNAPEFDLPHGHGSGRTWAFAVSLLGTAMERAQLAELVEGSAIAGYRDGLVTIEVPTAAQAERLSSEYGDLVARKLGEAMRRPVRIAVIVPATAAPVPPAASWIDVTAFAEDRPAPSFIVAECGLPSGQVWAAVIDEVATTAEVSRVNVDTWLRSTALIGRGDGGCLIVGVPHAMAQRRIAARFAAPLREAVAAVLGAERPLEIVVTRDWLAAHPYPTREQPSGDANVA